MLGATSLKASHHGNTKVGRRVSVEDEEERRTCVVDMNLQSSVGLHLQSSESCFQLDDDFKDLSNDWFSTGDPCQDISFSSDGCAKLEKRWMLWYEFMKEHSCLNDWLRSAEKTAATPNSSNVLYCAAKEELHKYESLRAEARIRLVQLDGLSQKSRTLVGLFRGAMCTRLVEMTKDCGQRWDQLCNTMDTVCRRLKHFVCQREDFERQREEMAVWLTDMDLRLTEVEHFSGKDTCSKMHQLQGFQEAVAESAGRLNDLLQRGEELIQRSEPADAQAIENQLQELLLHCTRVFQGLGRLHTRLLSMRLVFEEDWSLCAPDSGCPSESVLEDECFVDRSLAPQSQTCLHQSSQDHLVLEWDPSVDIGGSHDDTDSSSFSAAAGVSEEAGRYPLRRRVYTTPVDSQPDNGAINVKLPGMEKSLERTAPPQTPVPVNSACKPQYAGPFKTSTPETRFSEPVTFDPERISVWLGQTHQLCSKAVQTEHTPQACSSFPSLAAPGKKEGVEYQENVLPQRQQTRHTCSYPHPSVSCDLQHHSYGRHKDPQWLQEKLCFSDSLEENSCTKSNRDPYRLKAPAGRSWHTGSWSLRPLRLFEMRKASASMFVILFALLLALVVWPLISLHSSPCHQSNTLTRSFHLALHYKGPPPT